MTDWESIAVSNMA